jgi:cyclophilin family peptidyl-prolyl cis-trans isomerase/HEAT repeat protein
VPPRIGSGVFLLCGLALAACGPTEPDARKALLDVLRIEDARPTDADGREALVTYVADDDPATRRFAVRALGRLEDPALVDRISPSLTDSDLTVRATAAWALAQAVHGRDEPTAAEALLAAAPTETDADVRGEIARSLGRALGEDAPDGVLDLLGAWAAEPGLPPETAIGVALGLEALSRAPGAVGSDERVYEALGRLTGFRGAGAADSTVAARVRAVALLGLGQRDRLDAETVAEALTDPAPTVRAAAARFLGSGTAGQRNSLTDVAVADDATIVRIEAVRALAAAPRMDATCRELLRIAREDPAAIVRTSALDALAAPCSEGVGPEVVAHLDSVATGLPAGADGAWHGAVHALASLARLDAEAAWDALGPHAAHPNPFVRVGAAQVTAFLEDEAMLRALSADPDPNVRAPALRARLAIEGRAVDGALIENLSSDDPQLLMTVSELLDGSGHPEASVGALGAFVRVSDLERETTRDTRMALLELLASTGDASLAPRLEPYLTDFDPVVAARVAVMLSEWTGSTRNADPEPLPRLPLPTTDDVADMERNVVVLHMARGGEIVVELLPYLAPTNAHRFMRLAQAGHFDGLTFHRVVPNFVIQGGSPAANEYAGDGPYTRDEIGRISHWRGTVGLSTRGRDTGDGQIFVNLVDNVRLDHDYTVFGMVRAGMDVVDGVLAGDVIERAEIRPKD